MSNFSERYGNVAVDVENKEFRLPDGSIINEHLAANIFRAYELMSTANYLMDSYGVETVSEAWKKAGLVRELMDDNGYTEEDAIEEVTNP